MVEKIFKGPIEAVSKGKSPYLVYGFEVPDMGPRHAERVSTFEEVIAKMFDITNGATELKGQYAVDAENNEIFSASNSADVLLLKKLLYIQVDLML